MVEFDLADRIREGTWLMERRKNPIVEVCRDVPSSGVWLENQWKRTDGPAEIR